MQRGPHQNNVCGFELLDKSVRRSENLPIRKSPLAWIGSGSSDPFVANGRNYRCAQVAAYDFAIRTLVLPLSDKRICKLVRNRPFAGTRINTQQFHRSSPFSESPALPSDRQLGSLAARGSAHRRPCFPAVLRDRLASPDLAERKFAWPCHCGWSTHRSRCPR